MTLKKFLHEDLANWLILFTLLIQIFLIVSLTQKVTKLTEFFSEPATVFVERVPDEQGHSLGPADAPVTIVEFSDFQCPYCKSADLIVKQIMAQYPDKIRFVYRHFPLTTIHPYAMQAAQASECANEQGKFWEMHDLIFRNQQEFSQDGYSEIEFFPKIANDLGIDNSKFRNCLRDQQYDAYITKDMSDGLKYGVEGTPTFFVNKQRINGISVLETTIVKEIEEATK
jgi:protein-disulfide isomerase